MNAYTVAVVGGIGLVGRAFLRLLQERRFPMGEVRLLGSERTAGRKVHFRGEELEVQQLTAQSFHHVHLAFFAVNPEISSHYAPVAAKSGAVVVDNSPAFRMEPWVPLVVPEVNGADLARHRGIVANPNALTTLLALPLGALHRISPVERVIVDTYQSVSGAGQVAVEELSQQMRLVLEGKNAVSHVFPHQLAFNVLPQIDPFYDNGYSREEWRLIQETRKVLHSPELAISATCVRVPVLQGDSAAVHAELTRPITPEDAQTILGDAAGVKVLDEPDVGLYPHPWMITGQEDVLVGRIRRDFSNPRGLAFWLVGDNILRGHALNAVLITETMAREGWL
ncbi:MAG: aspartate-semialdehyde dehydrogenase [Chloroflexi bacterium]|nr:aspartate-semialdehyde dehydrogenase [Chloroflexota bacterium]